MRSNCANAARFTRWRLFTVLLGLLLGCSTSICAAANLTDAVNTLRARGCSGGSGTANKLKQTRALDAVAEEWAKGGRLQAALQRAEYRASNSSSMRVSGANDDRMIIGVLANNYCRIVTDPTFTDIGIERRGRDVWLVVAAPLNFPTMKDTKSVEREVLERVNQARSQPRKCGNTAFKPAPPLQLSAMLNRAALAHALDMARNNHFEHEGTDGSTPAQRIARAGYRWRSVAENIAAGAPTAESVVEGWLKSPGHCVNIMGAQYREMGIAFALEPKSEAGIYWAQEFATAR
ncbi:MAG TPA: CAP domain-containing protein [Steroidobacteraceae bacterium]|nr:CAP domain-containing protein [Steroidobacteraceae bacterium]